MQQPQQLEKTQYKSSLTRIVGALAFGTTATHAAIWTADHTITLLVYVLLLATAAAYAWQTYDHRPQLRRIRYGMYIPHLAGYVIVVGSFYLHALYLQMSGESGAIDAGWKGLLFGMGGFWGLGLLVHTAGTAATKGFDDVKI